MANLQLIVDQLDALDTAVSPGRSPTQLGRDTQQAANALENIIRVRVNRNTQLDLRTASSIVDLGQWPKLLTCIKAYIAQDPKSPNSQTIYGCYVAAYSEWEVVCRELGISPS